MEQPWLPTSFNLLMLTVPRSCLLLHSPLVCHRSDVTHRTDDPLTLVWEKGFRLTCAVAFGLLAFAREEQQRVTQTRCEPVIDWQPCQIFRSWAEQTVGLILVNPALPSRGAQRVTCIDFHYDETWTSRCVVRVTALISVFCAGSQRPTPSWWATWHTAPAAWTTSLPGPSEPTSWFTMATAVWVSVFVCSVVHVGCKIIYYQVIHFCNCTTFLTTLTY